MARGEQEATHLRMAVVTDVTEDVDEDEDRDETPRHKTLAEAIEGGDYLEILLAQRRAMATDVLTVGGPAKAAMYRQMAMLSKDIAGLELERKVRQEEEGDGDEDDDAPDEPIGPETF